jgi:CBS domain containing-hemolysin-like protein
MSTAINITGVFLLVLINGFFVAAEFALVGLRRSRIEALAAEGDRRAQRVLSILDNLNAYLSACQLGITIASLALGALGEPAFARLLEGPLHGRVSDTTLHILAYIVSLTVITCLHIVLGEQAPKIFGLERAERVSLACALPLQIFYKIFSWPIRALDWASARIVRLFGFHATSGHASSYTAEELRQLIDLSHKSGHLEADEQELINRVFDFKLAEVREAMVPRTAVVALPATATLEEVEDTFQNSGFSRLPVYRDRIDDVLGVLFLKDLLPFLRNTHAANGANNFEIEKLLQPPVFVPATARLGSALAQMQSAQRHLAFVVDEHGGVEGIVTLEDLLEEIVGEINDEYDEETRAQVVAEKDGSYLLDGMIAVRDANRRFDLRLPEEAGYTTLAGFLLAQSGRLLHVGETVNYDGAQFTVERVEHRRIRRIRYIPLDRDNSTDKTEPMATVSTDVNQQN